MMFGSSIISGRSGLLQTPDSHKDLVHNDDEMRGHRVQFSDSPGVLESGFFNSPEDDGDDGGDLKNQMMMFSKSPSEQQGGWFDFIPGLLSKGSKQQQQQVQSTSSETSPLIINRRRSSSAHPNNLESSKTSLFAQQQRYVIADDSPHRYTHFSEAFHTNRSKSEEVVPDVPLNNQPYPEEALTPIENDVEDTQPPLPKTPSDSQLFTTTRIGLNNNNDTDFSLPVMASAVGSIMPETPLELPPPMTPPMSPLSDYNSIIKTDERPGGFGVSLKMLPTETSKLLHPSSSPRKTPVHTNFGMSQFYSFQNNNEDEYYPSTTAHNNEDVGRSTYRNNTMDDKNGEDADEYDGGGEEEEDEREQSHNMINYYSGRQDHQFSLSSPTKTTSRRHHPSQSSQQQLHPDKNKLQQLSSVNNKTSGGKFILGFLFGNEARDSTGGRRRTVVKSRKKGLGGIRSSSSSGAERVRPNHHRSVSRQKRAATAAKRKRARLRRRVPEHLRVAHARAAQITERFRGLLRAEVEKV